LVLQNESDSFRKKDIVSRYSVLASPQEYIQTYTPLIKTLRADIVGIQSAAINQEALMAMIGNEVLPELRKIN
jgi:hypothetical protein